MATAFDRAKAVATLGEPEAKRVVRDGDLDLAFEGWLLGEGEHGTGGSSGFRKDWTRGVHVRLWLTVGGALVAGVKRWSRWQGEVDRWAAEAFGNVGSEDALLAVLDWLRDDAGGELGEASKDAWEAACGKWPGLEGYECEAVDEPEPQRSAPDTPSMMGPTGEAAEVAERADALLADELEAYADARAEQPTHVLVWRFAGQPEQHRQVRAGDVVALGEPVQGHEPERLDLGDPTARPFCVVLVHGGELPSIVLLTIGEWQARRSNAEAVAATDRGLAALGAKVVEPAEDK